MPQSDETQCKFCSARDDLVEFKVPREPFSVQVVCKNCHAKLLTVWSKLFSAIEF